mmetsp:Transcript_13746/g.39245  ORF Transcript_13746/g.39245 Transcript_13746/m.39245 type:complete len:781 (-) Transcript_13746:278-2620(-)
MAEIDSVVSVDSLSTRIGPLDVSLNAAISSENDPPKLPSGPIVTVREVSINREHSWQVTQEHEDGSRWTTGGSQRGDYVDTQVTLPVPDCPGLSVHADAYFNLGQTSRFATAEHADGSRSSRSTTMTGLQMSSSNPGVSIRVPLPSILPVSCSLSATLRDAGLWANDGVTERDTVHEKSNGSYERSHDVLRGVACEGAGGTQFDTGTASVTNSSCQHEGTTTTTRETRRSECRVLGQVVSSEEHGFTQHQQRLLGSTFTGVDHDSGTEMKVETGLLTSSTTTSVGGRARSSLELRPEVLAAAKVGAQVGASQARRANEQELHLEPEAVARGLWSGAETVALQAVAGVVGHVAGEVAGRAAAAGATDKHPHSVVGVAIGASVASGVAATLTTPGDAGAKSMAGLRAAAESAALSAVADATVGAGVSKMIARAARACAETEGGMPAKVVAATRAAVASEASAFDVATSAVTAAVGNAAWVPTGLIKEERRMGLEFRGGDYVAVGACERRGQETMEDGARVDVFESQCGVQARMAVPQSLGLAGVRGSIGKTERIKQRNDGRHMTETMCGFAGGLDVLGVTVAPLDTGTVTVEGDNGTGERDSVSLLRVGGIECTAGEGGGGAAAATGLAAGVSATAAAASASTAAAAATAAAASASAAAASASAAAASASAVAAQTTGVVAWLTGAQASAAAAAASAAATSGSATAAVASASATAMAASSACFGAVMLMIVCIFLFILIVVIVSSLDLDPERKHQRAAAIRGNFTRSANEPGGVIAPPVADI